MLKKYTLIIIVTIAACAISAEEFFLIKNLPKQLAPLLHNLLASLVGAGFIGTFEILRRRSKKIDYNYFIFLAIGIAMLSIHLIKILLSKCS
ncbi:MAG: hypothetical protein WCL13_03945 [bacterium]